MTEACQKCWLEISEHVLNELVVIGLDAEEIRKRVLGLEKVMSKKWEEIKKDVQKT